MSRRHRAYGTLSATLASALLVASCSAADPARAAREDIYPHWKKGAGATEAAAFMKVEVPKGAADVKGAVQVNPQEDIYLLTFRTDRTTAIRLAEDLAPEEPLERWKVRPTPSSEHFRHFGLPEPETVPDALHAGVCPPCVEDHRRREVSWIEIHLGDVEAVRTRVYLRAY
ncbi:hypothetical protein OG357_27085 [Streptomyces sp. NBC_01255]|uniref:hypothetical protein n=1 Tax=Streptomyces sp. NBC_01255 TaxID=2903798 RepID=UPI002E3120E5|nr:hypothetical protein [Streptomyces sp. NBC_01255]